VSIPGIELGEGDGPDQRVVTSNYFSQLGIPVLQGRGFSEQDRQGAPMVIVVNEAASRKYWPGRSPVGQPLSVQGLDRTVIGVVADIRQYGLEQQTPATLYAPSTQEGLRGAELLIRTARDPMASLPAVKAALWSVSREQIFSPDISTLESRLDGLLAVRRFNMALLSILGLMGLVIAAVGIFGVMAYAVAQRMTEMGIRISLGATRSHILAMVLRDATALIAAGLLIGSVATWRLSSLAEAFLFQIRPADPRVFAGALGLLVLVGLIAALVPARRAASVDPLVALKDT
jgi:hypothetical protein